MRSLTWAIGLTALALVAADDPAALEFRQGPAVLRVVGVVRDGERLRLPLSGELWVTMELAAAPGRRLEPILPPDVPEGWERERVEEEPLRRSFRLVPQKPGSSTVTLPPLRFRDGDGDWQTVTWDPLPLQVTTEVLRPDRSELRDITPPEGLPEPPGAPPWLGAILVAANIVAVAALLLRFRRGRRIVEETPSARALRELAELAARPPQAPEDAVRHLATLSDAVRRYLEAQFGLPATRRTTAEFLRGQCVESPLTVDQREVLRDLLQSADLAKFARVTADTEACARLLDQARELVMQTSQPLESAKSADMAHPG